MILTLFLYTVAQSSPNSPPCTNPSHLAFLKWLARGNHEEGLAIQRQRRMNEITRLTHPFIHPITTSQNRVNHEEGLAIQRRITRPFIHPITTSQNLLPPLLPYARIKKLLGLGLMPHETSSVAAARARIAKLVQQEYIHDPGLQGSIVKAHFLKFIECAHGMLGPRIEGKKRNFFDAGCADGKMLLYVSEATFGNQNEAFEVYGAELGYMDGANTCFPARILQNTNLNQVAPLDVDIVYVFLACEEHLKALFVFLFQPNQNNKDVVVILCDGDSGTSKNRLIHEYLPTARMETLRGSTEGGSSHVAYIFQLKNLSAKFRTEQTEVAERIVADIPRVSMLDSSKLANELSLRRMVRRSANERTFLFQEAKKKLLATCDLDENSHTKQINKYFKDLEFTHNVKATVGFYQYLSQTRIKPQTPVKEVRHLIIQYVFKSTQHNVQTTTE